MSVIFIFIDGIGVGENIKENPLANKKWRSFSHFTQSNGIHKECEARESESVLFKAIDANLGVEGLPQSGTGQVTLFSGVNASKMIGKHFGPFPYSTTKPFLEEGSLFHQVQEMGKKPHFINGYPEIFFKRAERIDRWSATTLMTRSANVRLNTTQDVLDGKAITAEIKQNIWREKLNLDVPEITEPEAADRLLLAAKEYDLVMYEFYLTDKAGHSMDREYADQIRDVLDPFLMHIIDHLPEDVTLVITSDHGNLEDLTTKTHTRNEVPLFVMGDIEPFRKAESLIDITPGIIEVLQM
ncbi:MAG: alkaline phosphatase family protein [Balneolaceae bacterium]